MNTEFLKQYGAALVQKLASRSILKPDYLGLAEIESHDFAEEFEIARLEQEIKLQTAINEAKATVQGAEQGFNTQRCQGIYFWYGMVFPCTLPLGHNGFCDNPSHTHKI